VEDIYKTSYDHLTIILKAGEKYISEVNIKGPHHFINKATHPKN
jgi:hypothetical protein